MIAIKKLFWLLLLFPLSVKAANCDYQDMARYQKLASNINFSYDFVEANNSVTFNITVSNMPVDLYIVDTFTGNQFSYQTVGASETILYGYKPGANYKFNIVPYDEMCFGSVVLRKYINLPAFNAYYLDPVCNGAESFELCQKWVDHDLSYNEFVKQVKKHKISSNNNVVEKEVIDENDFLNKIIVGFLNNYIIILLSIIMICTVGIVILAKKDKFDLK